VGGDDGGAGPGDRHEQGLQIGRGKCLLERAARISAYLPPDPLDRKSGVCGGRALCRRGHNPVCPPDLGAATEFARRESGLCILFVAPATPGDRRSRQGRQVFATVTQSVYHMTYLQAIVIGLVQGATELFPISSLGHTVLIPAWIGGTWGTLVRQESTAESPYLAFVVGLHLATALVLLGFYAREWARLIAGFFTSIVRRRVSSDQERLAWLIVIATIPVGIFGLVFEHEFRVLFAKPIAAALFLMLNGLILSAGELYRRRSQRLLAAGAADPSGSENAGTSAKPTVGRRRFRDERIVPMDARAEQQLARIGVTSTAVIGASQALALLAGVSREGVTMVGGLFRGLNNENAMRFAFLLSTPVIFAAGALKIPDLLGPLGNGTRPQVIVGSLAAAFTSLLAVLFLSRYFKTRTLLPFAVYSLVFGFVSALHFGLS
jgi:undecaprenyl-diphosphatase